MRREARETALQILFSLDLTKENKSQIAFENYATDLSKDSLAFCHEIVDGVLKNITEIDEKIQTHSRHWKLDRMPSVDRNLLRLSVFELFYSENKIDAPIIIDEAIEIGKKFGTTESSGFINGILDALVQSRKP